MIFQKKKSIIVAHTLAHCESCGSSNKKRFVPGDYIYKSTECVKCGNTAIIQGIFGQEQI